jgi:hypothetical protein
LSDVGSAYATRGAEENAIGVSICLALGAIALCAVVATVFFGVHVFHNHHGHHHHNDDLKQEVITSESKYNITNDNFGGCEGDVTIDQYRLQRTGKFVTLFVQGTCVNTSSIGDSLDIDLDMEQFPDRFRCPTGSSSDDAAVMGTGSAIVVGENIACNLQIEANSNEDQIDIDFDFSNTVPDGSDVTFSIVVGYDVGRC